MGKLPTMFKKILMPYLVLMLVTLLLILTVVNLSLRAYAFEASSLQIQGTFDAVRILLKEQVTALAQTQTPAKALTKGLTNTLKILQRTSPVVIVALRPNQEWLLPKTLLQDLDQPPIPPALLARIKARLDQNPDYYLGDQAHLERIGRSRFLVGSDQLNRKLVGEKPPLSVFLIAPMTQLDAFMQGMNRILLLAALVALLISSAIAAAVANKLSNPVKVAAFHATSIKKGHYHRIQEKPTTQEISLLYEGMNAMSALLESAEEEQNRYFQDLSHDLRTPLMSIQGYAEGIKAGIFDKPDQAAEIISTESKRLKNLLDNLLFLARIESAAGGVTLEPIELLNFIDSRLAHSHQLARQRQVQLLIACDGTLSVLLDEQLLGSILENLCDNAIRYAKTQVMIDVLYSRGTLSLAIHDDGPGIEPKVQAHLFERFAKGSDGHQGLGLSIVKSAADKLNGTIDLSTDSMGTRFLLKIPCKLSE